MMKKHYVEFFSPGTFVSETNTKEVDSWDVDVACEMARSITQRYNATPYGFRFITRSRTEDELDAKITDKSNMYYLGGEVETLEEVEARNHPDEAILRSNMRNNNIDRIITNTNSWKFTGELHKEDVVLDWTP